MLKKIALAGLFVLTSAMALPLVTPPEKATTVAVSAPTPSQPRGNCPTPWFPWLCK